MPGLTPNTTYYFVVRAEDEAGNVDSNIVECSQTVQTPQFIDLYPSNVNNDGTDITFNVSNSGTIDANNVRVVVLYENDGDWCMEFIVIVPAGGSVPLVAGLTYATTYYILIDPDNTILESNEANNVACTEPYCSSPPSLGTCIYNLNPP